MIQSLNTADLKMRLGKKINIKILAIAPVFGWTGDAINERQLIFSLAHYVNRIYVISLIGGGVISAKKVYFRVKPPKNVCIIPIPYPVIPYPLVSIIQSIIFSVFLAPLIIILKRSDIIHMVYVRGSIEAAGLMISRTIAKCSIVKTVFFPEDEITTKIKNRFVKKIIMMLCKKIDRYVLEKCDKIAVPNIVFGEKLVQRRGLKSKKLIITPPGINLSNVIHLTKDKERCNEKKDVRIGFVGNFSSYQGLDILIRAMQIVQKVFPNAILCMVGSYPSLYAQEYQKIKLLIKNLKVKTQIIGVVPHEEALKLLASFDMLVIPRRKFSSTELNVPIKAIEAFALGVPVVITRHEVCEKMFRDKEGVVFVEPDPKDVADKIMLLISDENLAAKLRKNGYKLAEQFDYDSIAYTLALACRGDSNSG
jgi:glycosyltransferase involved in cell wall biosynthesis